MGTHLLPPEGYSWGAQRDQWGVWQEVWTATDPPLTFEVRRGWVVQIGAGAVGREVSIFEQPTPEVLHTVETPGMERLSFRARKIDPDSTGKRMRFLAQTAKKPGSP